MSRPASGDDEVLKNARAAVVAAETPEQLRQAQAVVLPLDYGLSLEDTAQVMGVSRGWVCQLRRRFIQGQLVAGAGAAGGRQRQNMSLQDEREFLAPFLAHSASGGRLVVSELKVALEQRLGRTVAQASVYNLLHRHGWNKLAGEQRQPTGQAQRNNRPASNRRGAKPSS